MSTATELPPHLLERLRQKIQASAFDAGQSFSLANAPADEEATADAIARVQKLHLELTSPLCLVASAPIAPASDIWPIDHCWSFRYRELEDGLLSHPGILPRVEGLIGLQPMDEKVCQEARAHRVARHAWSKLQCVRLSTTTTRAEDRSPGKGDEQGSGEGEKVVVVEEEATWYFLDEVGSALLTPAASPFAELSSVAFNAAIVYVHFPDLGFTGSAFWPTEALEPGDIVAAPLAEAASYIAALIRVPTEDEAAEDDDPLSIFEAYQARPAPPSATLPMEPETKVASVPSRRPLTVYTDSELVHQNVVDNEERWRSTTSDAPPPFVVADRADAADILWLCHEPLSDGAAFPSAVFLNQFPKEEFVFTSKNGLARWIQQRYGRGLPWFADAYDLTDPTERNLLTGHWLWVDRARCRPDELYVDGKDLSNLWIVKPHNMARSMDMVISDELTEVLRMGDAGPKLVCQYVSRPRTMRGRKFDLRFIVLLSALEPNLELYLFDEFWIRFAAEQYSLDHFHQYDKHWTVMNYGENKSKMLQMKYYDFISNLNEELSAECGTKVDVWPATYARIQRMCRDAFSAITPLEGTVQQARYRAMYGLDVILRDCDPALKSSPADLEREGLQPVLLEITYSPDCHRACTYHPTFYYDAFSTLFLGEPRCATRV